MKSLRSYFYRAAAWFGMDLQGALRMAARVGDTGTVKTLLEAGARDDTALGVAAFNGNAEAVKLLVQGGANVLAKNNEALRRAAMIGRTDIVKLLLNAGADVHANNGEALSRAEYFGHTETAAVLKEWMARERGAADPEMGRGSAAGPKIHPY